MARNEVAYEATPRGLGTNYTESGRPAAFASRLENRFVNSAGGWEKRQGIVRLGDPASGGPSFERFAEFVSKTGESTWFAMERRNVWKFDEDAGTWSNVHTLDSDGVIRSIQFGDRMIFFNGVDRNVFTRDGTEFDELRAVIEEGESTSGTNTTNLDDADISDWVTGTDINVNDLVYNPSRGGFGIVTEVSSDVLVHTSIASGATGLGQVDADQAVGDRYEVIDLVELNIIPTSAEVDDNAAVAASGSGPTTILVDDIDFATTDVRVGDYVRNTTRAAVARVDSIATALTVTSVASQQDGDSLVFLKSAMPLTDYAHVHFNRLYYLDARDRRRVRISGANDPRDLSTDAATLDPITYNFNNDVRGDVLVAMGSYQQRFVLAGRNAIYIYSGTTPIGENADFVPIGAFPQGVVAPDGLLDIGNDLLFVTRDGLQAVSVINDATDLNRAFISEPVRADLRRAIENSSPDDIRLIHYPKRSLVWLKIGQRIHVYNYTDNIRDRNRNIYGGTWSVFTGALAQQNAFLTRQEDGVMRVGGDGGQMYQFDVGTYSDDGEVIDTIWQTAWLTLEKSPELTIKQGHWFQPLLEAPGGTDFTITSEGGWRNLQSVADDASLTSTAGAAIGTFTIGTDPIGGGRAFVSKIPARWRGEVCRFKIESSTTTGPEIIGRYSIIATEHGRR